ncbi:MAG: hypothetical protein J6C23_06635 [Clostridia bacterium]|nr:hypothetical protein [Clostridia bacterium]
MKKFLSFILIFLAIVSLFVGFFTVAVLSSKHPGETTVEGMYYMLHYSWIYWLFMLIPIGCLLFGILLKRKKNLIIGIIFSGLLFGFGCFFLIGLTNYSTDTSYVEKLGKELEICFPKARTVITEDHTVGKQISREDNYCKYESVARFNNSTEISLFISNLDNQKWCTEKEPIKDMIPILADFQTNDYEYFLIYCYETKSFSEKVAVSKYNYIFMAFDVDKSVLYIREFVQK